MYSPDFSRPSPGELYAGHEHRILTSKVAFQTDYNGSLHNHFDPVPHTLPAAYYRTIPRGIPILGFTSQTGKEVVTDHMKWGTLPYTSRIVEGGAATILSLHHVSRNAVEKVISPDRITEKRGRLYIQNGEPLTVVHNNFFQALGEVGFEEKDVELLSAMKPSRLCELVPKFTPERAKFAIERKFQDVWNFRQDMPIEEQEAIIASMREFLPDDYVIEQSGMFWTMSQGASKGTAAAEVRKILEAQYNQVYTIGIGDTRADFPLLLQCDRAFIIDNPYAKKPLTAKDMPPGIEFYAEQAPKGWNSIVDTYLDFLSENKYVH